MKKAQTEFQAPTEAALKAIAEAIMTRLHKDQDRRINDEFGNHAGNPAES